MPWGGILGLCPDGQIKQRWKGCFVCAVEYKSLHSRPSLIPRQGACCDRNSHSRKRGALSKKVADIIVETLESTGVKHCYGVVGDTLNMIAHSISQSAIEWVGVRHEEAGAFAAPGRSLVDRHPHRSRRKLRSRQPAFHQWHRRGEPQSRTRHSDRQPDRSRRIGVRFPPRGRLQGDIRELQRLLRHDPDPRTGPAQDRDGLAPPKGLTFLSPSH